MNSLRRFLRRFRPNRYWIDPDSYVDYLRQTQLRYTEREHAVMIDVDWSEQADAISERRANLPASVVPRTTPAPHFHSGQVVKGRRFAAPVRPTTGGPIVVTARPSVDETTVARSRARRRAIGPAQRHGVSIWHTPPPFDGAAPRVTPRRAITADVREHGGAVDVIRSSPGDG